MRQTEAMLAQIWEALGGDPALARSVRETGDASLPSVFAVSDFASASTAAAGLALAEWVGAHGESMPDVVVDRRLASLWFSKSIRPVGWALPPQWDSVAGDYEARDGWIRLHTNAPHHRAAALSVLAVPEDRALVAQAVRRLAASDLEAAIVAANGCAAQMRSLADWAEHPQGRAVAAEPLMARSPARGNRPACDRRFDPARPLAGMRVLDLTRVLAGPVATRFLAGFGADVLRIDPPGWDEPAVLPEVTLGKRRARLDLRRTEDRATFERLLGEADVFVHGYRADALEALGYSPANLARLSPGLIDVSLDAYGWSGPWRNRRGFDSLVQMSSGLADAGMRAAGAAKPVPLPVQALDYGTGCLLAAAVLRALTTRLVSRESQTAAASLARTAHFLAQFPADPDAGQTISGEAEDDVSDSLEATFWGPAKRLRAPVQVGGVAMSWDIPAGPLGDAEPRFST